MEPRGNFRTKITEMKDSVDGLINSIAMGKDRPIKLKII